MYERKKEIIFNVHEAKDSLWDRLFLHLDVFGLFSMKLDVLVWKIERNQYYWKMEKSINHFF